MYPARGVYSRSKRTAIWCNLTHLRLAAKRPNTRQPPLIQPVTRVARLARGGVRSRTRQKVSNLWHFDTAIAVLGNHYIAPYAGAAYNIIPTNELEN